MKESKSLLLSVCFGLLLGSSCLLTDVARADSAAPSASPSIQNVKLTNDRGEPIQLKGADNFQLKWQAHAVVPTSLVTDAKGNLYFSTMYGIYAVSSEGKALWNYPYRDNQSIGLKYMALGQDGNLYAFEGGSILSSEKDKKGDLLVLNLEGQKEWTYTFTDMSVDWMPPFTADAKGNFITLTDKGITSINKEGHTNWVNNENISISEMGHLHVTNIYSIKADQAGTIYMDGSDGLLYALDAATGKVIWKFLNVIGNVYIGNDGHIYVSTDTGVQVLNANDGSKTGKSASQDAINKLHIPNDGDGGFYFPHLYEDTMSGKKKMNAIEDVGLDGKVKWTYKTPDSQYGDVSNLVSDLYGNVYFTDEGGNIYSLDRTGNERFILFSNNSTGSGTDLIVTGKGELFSLNENYGLIRLGSILPPITVMIDEQEVIFPMEPRISEGTTLVPMRAMFEKLEAKVEWDNESRTITAAKGESTISLTLDSTTARVNGRDVELEAAPTLIDGSTYVPLRFISEALGDQVSWDNKNRAVHVTTKK